MGCDRYLCVCHEGRLVSGCTPPYYGVRTKLVVVHNAWVVREGLLQWKARNPKGGRYLEITHVAEQVPKAKTCFSSCRWSLVTGIVPHELVRIWCTLSYSPDGMICIMARSC
jgi:hypothetical protein